MKAMLMKMMLRMMPKTARKMMMKQPLRHLALTQKQEYSCDDAYDVLDVYAEMSARGEDTSALMPLVKLHLEICDNCREEFQALLKAIAGMPL